MKEFLSELISIPSIKEEPAINAPFGASIRKALDVFLTQAQKLGLKTHDENGYYGWAEYGKGEDIIAIACHIDVVPATSKWTYPPFALTEKDGVYYGRGVADDKGAIAVALQLLKELKTEQTELSHRVRLIVGCDEESGSECMKKYNEVDEIPIFTIVPDADFPVVNSEKGILHFTLSAPACYLSDEITAIHGGQRPNIVCDNAYLVIKRNSVIGNFIAQNKENTLNCPKIKDTLAKFSVNCKDLSIEENNDGYAIKAIGTASHAMCVTEGDNAIFKLFAFLCAFSNEVNLGVIDTLAQKVCSCDIAKKLGVYCSDSESGDLTINLGIISFNGENLDLTFDARLPLVAKPETVINALVSLIPNCKITSSSFSPNLFIAQDTPQIKALLSAYEEVCNEKGYCKQTGGGTYARSLPCAVAFGPTFSDFETNIHNADEKFRKNDLDKALKIYKSAILKLDKILK